MARKSNVSMIVALAILILLITVFGLLLSLYQTVIGIISFENNVIDQKIIYLMVYEFIIFLILFVLNIILLFLFFKRKEKFRNFFILFTILYIGMNVGDYFLAREYVWEIYDVSREFRNAALGSIRNAASMALPSSVIIAGLYCSDKAKEFFAN